MNAKKLSRTLAAAAITIFAAKVFAEDSSFMDFLEKNQKEHYDANLGFADLISADRPSDLADDTVDLFCETAQILQDKRPFDHYYEVFRHVSLPIYFYLFGAKKYQDLTFDRISDFVEQDEGKLVDPESHHYPEDDGNDLRARDVADFFNAMKARGSGLTAFENRLKSSLIGSGNFEATSDGLVRAMRDFAIVSAALDSGSGTVEHELSHAVYFTDPAYRQKVIALYESLTTADRQRAARILSDIGGHKFEKSAETFYTEFGAYFRDPPVLYRDGGEDHVFSPEDHRLLEEVASGMARIESETAFFHGCGAFRANLPLALVNIFQAPALPIKIQCQAPAGIR